MESQIKLIIHNIRSCHNVGAMLRTAEGLGIDEVIMTGYTPYPKAKKDDRLPHIAEKINKSICKTSLGAEKSLNWQQQENIDDVITQLKLTGFTIVALEQAKDSVELGRYQPHGKLALIVGNEIIGVESAVLELCDRILEIPMQGQKESFNVASATAIALYSLKNS